MNRVGAWWQNLSIAKKLYFVVGIMAFLIAGELMTLSFAMGTLSASRAFVGGESLWSKGQKDAVFSLQRFGRSHDEKDFEDFKKYLKIPESDHQARVELMKPKPDLNLVRHHFLNAAIHPDDIDPIIHLLRRFYWVSYLSRAISIWTKGDLLMDQLRETADQYHLLVKAGQTAAAQQAFDRVRNLNADLTTLEADFSYSLGEGSRWLESVVLSILFTAVLIVESVGLTLTFRTSRAISRGLNDLETAAEEIGRGNFMRRVSVRSNDEIGRLGVSVNKMGTMLEKSYGELEARVNQRTSELTKMAAENERLYEEAKSAVQTRDEFLSIASHELRTPLTSLSLQLQHLDRAIRSDRPNKEATIKDVGDKALHSAKRLQTLLDELLDLTRLKVGKFEIRKERRDVVQAVCDVVSSLGDEAAKKGSDIEISTTKSVFAQFDYSRICQAVTNLLSNAIKYGEGKPIKISVEETDGYSRISVRDHGIGIPREMHSKIFDRFERVEQKDVPGLGLGLYITKQIVELHGGHISLDSDVGRGSVFAINLPRA